MQPIPISTCCNESSFLGSNTWQDGPALPHPAQYAAHVQTVEGSKTFLMIGGANSDFSVNYNSVLTFEGGQWVELPTSMEIGRHDAAAVLVGEYMSGCWDL